MDVKEIDFEDGRWLELPYTSSSLLNNRRCWNSVVKHHKQLTSEMKLQVTVCAVKWTITLLTGSGLDVSPLDGRKDRLNRDFRATLGDAVHSLQEATL
jgi:hypothetical protein